MGGGSAGIATYSIGAKNLDTTYSGILSGANTALTKTGTGTLTLGGGNTYTGITTVSAGSLIVNGSLAASTTTVATAGTLGGIGTLAGVVTCNGKLAPGSGGIGTLIFQNGLNLSSSTVLNHELGAVASSDKLQVAGAFVLDGTVNVTAAAGFGAGTYTLAAYTGTLTDSGLLVGTMPSGFTGTIAASAGTVRLTVASTLTPMEQWQIANFGSTGNTNAAASADPDADGTKNEIEFRLGLDPKNGNSAFKALGALAPSGYTLTWPTAAGLTFEIRRGTSLNGSWSVIGTVTGVGTFTDTNPPVGKAFYRVALLP